jgi:tRNA (guanine10-N2)-dimethyltransferase
MFIFQLAQDHPDIAIAEIEQLFNLQKEQYQTDKTKEWVLITKRINENRFPNLAFTKYIYKTIPRTTNKNKPLKIESYKVILLPSNKDFTKEEQQHEYNYYHDIQEKPKANLKNPKELFVTIKIPINSKNRKDTKSANNKTKNTLYRTQLVYSDKKTYLLRKPHLRKKSQPISLSPKLAKAMINLANKKKIYDPFCGTGGILLEAYHNNIEAIGSDIDNKMIHFAKENLKEDNAKAKLSIQDALTTKIKAPAIITDVPYGRSTKAIHKDLYTDFLKYARTITKRIVICFPDFSNPKQFIQKLNFKILYHFKVYIHKSLTREIFVLENKKE